MESMNTNGDSTTAPKPSSERSVTVALERLTAEAGDLKDALARGAASNELAQRFSEAVDLPTFRASTKEASAEDGLTLDEQLTIVDQALVLIEHNYVHLPLKEAMHAVDPVQRLRLLRARLESADPGDRLSPHDFHREMSTIFHSVRDLHTNYLLPQPYASRVAFLPFLIEEYWVGDRDEDRRYLVSHVADGFVDLPLKTEVTHWNGMTIDRAVAANAARYAGSNEAARRARGVESLTVRPLVIHLPPDEDWVVVGYTEDDERKELRVPWLVVENLPAMTDLGPKVTDTETALGLDLDGDETSRASKLLFAQQSVAADGEVLAAAHRERAAGTETSRAGEVPSLMPEVFRARRVPTKAGLYGHVRVFTFNTDDPWGFVLEFVRLTREMPPEGLIVDVRGNGGGHIWASELLLQTLTPGSITPEPAEFIRSSVNLELCRLHELGRRGIDLGPWVPSLEEAVETGAIYSRAFPITPSDATNALGQQYHGPVVLITDARCYSATDIFAAGFKDHDIGVVIGVDANTGAGGANVWRHGLLGHLYSGDSSPYTELPAGVDMRVSIRRTLRVGATAGTPVEDLGVRPDIRHRMTRRDLTESNADLLDRAGDVLAAQPVRMLEVGGEVNAGGELELDLRTQGIDRVDVYVDDRPWLTENLANATEQPPLVVPGALGGVELRVEGFEGNELVAVRKGSLGPLATRGWGIAEEPIGRARSGAIPEVVHFLVHAPGASLEDLKDRVQDTWGRGYEVRHLFADGDPKPEPTLDEHFDVSGRLHVVDPAARRRQAFELARQLMRATGFEVQPDLAATVFGPDEIEGDEELVVFGGRRGDEPLPGTEDADWALELMKVDEVRGMVGGDGVGIRIGHPDTGYTHHVELGGEALDFTKDRDVLDDDDDARDPLKKGFLGLWGNPGHGTGTGSVIVSRESHTVTGVAPASTLVPIRAITSVVLVFDGNVARAIDYARRNECHVISMSLGGVGFSSSLRAAIRAAIADGVLVLAAAGNEVGFVVAPANYPEVIAVAATNIEDEPWSGSSHGDAVDVSAPGESVHAARARKGQNALTSRSSGTSYAVAQTAGIAALWLAHHGHEALASKYGKENLQRVFRHVLRTTSRAPNGWDPSEYGDGIVDAKALLTADLPDIATVASMQAALPGPGVRLAAYLPAVTDRQAEGTLAELLPGVASEERDLYAGELAYLMVEDASVRAGLAAIAGGAAGNSAGEQAAAAAARLKASASPSLAARLGGSL